MLRLLICLPAGWLGLGRVIWILFVLGTILLVLLGSLLVLRAEILLLVLVGSIGC